MNAQSRFKLKILIAVIVFLHSLSSEIHAALLRVVNEGTITSDDGEFYWSYDAEDWNFASGPATYGDLPPGAIFEYEANSFYGQWYHIRYRNGPNGGYPILNSPDQFVPGEDYGTGSIYVFPIYPGGARIPQIKDDNDRPPCPECPTCPGMPTWQVSEPYISLWLHDEPLGYQPAVGPRISFQLNFKPRGFNHGLNPALPGVGKYWNCSWVSYVTRTNSTNWVYLPGGGKLTFSGTNDYLTNTRLTGDSTNGFTLSYPDGSKDVYGMIVTNKDSVFLYALMTERWNAQAQKFILSYSSYNSTNPAVRLQYVIDGDGRTNSIYYTNKPYSSNVISRVVDPFGRTNYLAYDSVGRLTNIIDVAGISSSFQYELTGWITNMTTPYGTTSFVFTEGETNGSPNGRSVLVNEPDGSHQLFLYADGTASIPASYSNGLHTAYNTYTLFTNNLITNAGNETASLVGWTQVSGSTWAQRSSDPAAQSGTYYFYAGNSTNNAELRQDVDVSGYSNLIDAGLINFHFSGYVRTYSVGTDQSRMVVEYRDGSSNILSTYDTGNLALPAWTLRSDVRVAPAATRSARVRLISTREGAEPNNDGYYDSLSLQISTNSDPRVVDGAPVPASFANTFDNSELNQRNSFHWNRQQYAALSTTTIASFTGDDFRKARGRHWLKSGPNTVGDTLSMERAPSAGGTTEGQKTWYDYAGKTNNAYEGTQIAPLFVSQVLPDGTTRYTRAERNNLGAVTNEVSTYSVASSVLLRTNTFTYAANEIDLIAVTNALGVQVSSNAYNTYHQVTANFNALNETTIYTYNATQQLGSILWPSGLLTTNIFGADNFVSQRIDVGFATNSFIWTNDLIATHTDPRGLTISNTWDALQRLRRVDYPDGTFITNSYNRLDLVRVVDRMGFTTSFDYDALRRMIAATNVNNVVTRYGYCGCGSIQSVTNAFGTALEQVTQNTYDLQGNLTQSQGPDNYTVTYSYNASGQLVSTTDGTTSITNGYNNQGLLISVANVFGQVSAVTYDILDRATNTVDANSISVASTYDNLNRLRTRTYPDTGVESFGYTLNVAGYTSHTNQLNQVTRCVYDAANRKTAETNANLEATQFTYNGAGDLLVLTDGKNQTTTWNYDQYGRATNKVDATSTEIFRYQYDANNRLTNRWTAAKANTVYSYDALGNLLTVGYPVSTDITLQYDVLNRLTNMTDAVGTTRYSYDSVGQLLSEDGPWSEDTVSYSYNNRLRSGLALTQPNTSPWTQSYGYDSVRRLTSVISPAGAFSYTLGGASSTSSQIKKLLLPNSSYITNTYDSMARLTGTYLKNNSGTVLNSHAYDYNVGSQRTKQTRTEGSFVDYIYDSIGQLKTASGKEPGGTTNRLHELIGYSYDAAGNLNYRTNNALLQTFLINSLNQLTNGLRSGSITVAGTTTSPATNVTVNGSNSLLYADNTFASTNHGLVQNFTTYTAIAQDSYGRIDTNTVAIFAPPSPTFGYDANGNLIYELDASGLITNRCFSYDDENQLIAVWVTNLWRSEFVYDGVNRRRVEKDYSWNGSAWVQTNETRFIYDGNLPIQHRDTNNTPLLTLTRGLDLSASLQGAGGIGGLLAMTESSAISPIHSYYHADGNGNVTALVNTNQIIVGRYLYDPFGVTLSISGPKAFANPYHFSSKPFHELSGNYDFLRRWYDPSLQRWLTRDPLGETGGLNLYGFVGNTAVNTVDFDGRLWGRLASKLSRMLSDFADSTSSPSETYLASLASDAAAWFSKTDPWYSTYQDVNEFRKSGARCYLRNKYAGLEEVVGTADIVRAVDYEDEYTAWEQLGYGIVGGSKSFLTVIGARAMVEPTVAAENVVYREISAADRIALEAGQPLVPRGTGGSILDHVRGQPTGHISASQTVEGTARFNGGNGLVEIDVNAATSGGTRFLSHPEVLEGVGARPKQIQKVLESGEVMFQGPIPPNAVRRIR